MDLPFILLVMTIRPDGSKTTVTRKDDGYELSSTEANGETVLVVGIDRSVALPAGFPDDVPIYAGAKVSTSARQKDMTMVTLTTADPVKTVLDFYGEKLKANGWDIKGTIKLGDAGMVHATKDERTCTASILVSNEETNVTLRVTKGEATHETETRTRH